MAGRQVNLVRDARVPARDDETARVRVVLNLSDEACDLVNAVARRVVAAKRAPEVAVDGFYEVTKKVENLSHKEAAQVLMLWVAVSIKLCVVAVNPWLIWIVISKLLAPLQFCFTVGSTRITNWIGI